MSYIVIALLAELFLLWSIKGSKLLKWKCALDTLFLTSLLFKGGLTVGQLHSLTLLIFLTTASVTDLQSRRIPDRITYTLMVIGIITALQTRPLLGILVNMLVYSLPLTFTYLLGLALKRRLIGLGDVKLSLGVGSFIFGLSLAKLFWLITFAAAALFGAYLLLKKRGEDELPLAPFMLIATLFIVLIF